MYSDRQLHAASTLRRNYMKSLIDHSFAIRYMLMSQTKHVHCARECVESMKRKKNVEFIYLSDEDVLHVCHSVCEQQNYRE